MTIVKEVQAQFKHSLSTVTITFTRVHLPEWIQETPLHCPHQTATSAVALTGECHYISHCHWYSLQFHLWLSSECQSSRCRESHPQCCPSSYWSSISWRSWRWSRWELTARLCGFTLSSGLRLVSSDFLRPYILYPRWSSIHTRMRASSSYLNGLLRHTSWGCSRDVHQPGITAGVMLSSFIVRLHFSARWPQNMSQTSRLFFWREAPGHFCHTFLSHVSHSSSVIQLFSLTWTNMPGANFSFGIVFRLKTTMGSFVPSARQLSKVVFFTVMVFWPLKSTVQFGGRSNEMGVSSIFPMAARGYLWHFFCFRTKLWKFSTFCSTSAGSFWAMWVFCRRVTI